MFVRDKGFNLPFIVKTTLPWVLISEFVVFGSVFETFLVYRLILPKQSFQKVCGRSSQKFEKILQIEFLVNQAEIESISRLYETADETL